jgi:hypothetical protein
MLPQADDQTFRIWAFWFWGTFNIQTITLFFQMETLFNDRGKIRCLPVSTLESLFFFSVLGLEFRAYTLNLSTSTIFCERFFETGSCEQFAQAGFEPRSSLSLLSD